MLKVGKSFSLLIFSVIQPIPLVMKISFLTVTITFLVFLGFIPKNSFALVSLESALLGNFSDKFSKEKDPLDYIFKREENLSGLSNREYREKLSLYRGFYEEGKNLVNQCKKPYELRYASLWEKSQVKRAIGSTMQYFTLDIISRSLPQYAKYFEFSLEDYTHLVDGIIQSSCSNNLSIISKKTLRNNFILRFKNDSEFRLPSVIGNPLFAENLQDLQPTKNAMEVEFKYATELFRSACAWSGASEDYGLMTPLLKNPMLFAFIVRQLEGQELEWKSATNSLQKRKTDKVLNTWCENLICRRVTPQKFKLNVYRMIGSDNLSEDLKKLYCEEISSRDYDLKATKDEGLIKKMKARGFEEENFLSSTLIALITGVPDFISRAKNFSDLEEVFRSSVDSTWLNWAKNQMENVKREVYYEEPLTFELVRNDESFKPFDSRFDLYFDINLGEFDRSVERLGKIQSSFEFEIPTQLILYVRNELIHSDPRDKISAENRQKRVYANLEKHIEELKKRFIVLPWKGDLTQFVTQELVEQVGLKEPKAFQFMNTSTVKVKLHLSYGAFALKSIKHQRDVLNNSKVQK